MKIMMMICFYAVHPLDTGKDLRYHLSQSTLSQSTRSIQNNQRNQRHNPVSLKHDIKVINLNRKQQQLSPLLKF